MVCNRTTLLRATVAIAFLTTASRAGEPAAGVVRISDRRPAAVQRLQTIYRAQSPDAVLQTSAPGDGSADEISCIAKSPGCCPAKPCSPGCAQNGCTPQRDNACVQKGCAPQCGKDCMQKCGPQCPTGCAGKGCGPQCGNDCARGDCGNGACGNGRCGACGNGCGGDCGKTPWWKKGVWNVFRNNSGDASCGCGDPVCRCGRAGSLWGARGCGCGNGYGCGCGPCGHGCGRRHGSGHHRCCWPIVSYDIRYPVNPQYVDRRNGRLYSAQGYGMPMAVPLAPNVGHTYNYGWGIPASRLTPTSRPADVYYVK